MDNITMNKLAAEVRTTVDTEMVRFCKDRGITSGWGVENHAAFCTEVVADIALSGLEEDELKFRLFAFFSLTANYSSFRQKYEGPGKPLMPSGGKKTGADLASQYLSKFRP